MTAKRVVPRSIARLDVENAVAWDAAEAGDETAFRFIESLERAYRALANHPAAGSPLLGLELNLPGLRVRPIGRFPYLIFYIEQADQVDVWRVLHAKRDIPKSLQQGPLSATRDAPRPNRPSSRGR